MGQQFSVTVNGFTSTMGRIKENEKQVEQEEEKGKEVEGKKNTQKLNSL